LTALDRTEDALRAYDAALKAEPLMAAAHFNRGTALEVLNDIKGARAAFEQAVALDPNYVDARASLAWADAQTGDATSARAQGELILAQVPSHVLARMAVASTSLQQSDLGAAAAHLSELSRLPDLTPVNQSIVLGLIGDLHDAANRPAEAFAAYQASNAKLKSLTAARFEAPGQETALGRVQRLIDWFERADPEPWQEQTSLAPKAADPKAHIFLVGFPRSGTTLLENVLAAHPEVVSLEEKDCLGPAEATYLNSNESLERLAGIGSREAQRHIDAYWSMVRSFGVEPRDRVFIDKMPLASVQLPLIVKLFPNARILFARRDPRDVVMSCFRRRFTMNASMYELLTLEGAARHYDAVMRLSALYSKILPLPQHVVRYESLVEDFEGTARGACEFLGLEWDQDLFDFAAKARTRGIATPSASQVTRGLNREGMGSWRRYREQMAAVLPILEPWVERFGYASE
jgi:tetratricopeptide (TPR) repeat protein